MITDPNSAPKAATLAQNNTDIVQAFTDAFTTDDVESFYKLIADDAEWVIMATGETFSGIEQIKQLTIRFHCRTRSPGRNGHQAVQHFH